jgi:predicted alpha/beta-hydrolase family hydrolase
MTKSDATPVTIKIDDERTVSGLLTLPKGARAIYVLAHGAGAGMTHPFLAKFAALMAERGIATLRYQFPYMEAGSRRPDSPKVAEAAVRAAVAEAARHKLPIIAGG